MTGAIPQIVSPTEILVTVEKCWSRHGRGDLGAGLASVGLAEGLFMTEQNGPFHLTEMQLAQAVDEKTFQRAQPYVREFTHRLRSGQTLGGRVAGPHGIYTVSLTVDGSTMTAACTCKAEEAYCKHVIALGLTYIEEPQSFYDLCTLIAQLEGYRSSDLIQLIIRMATRYPQLLGMLGVEGFAEEGEDEEDEDEVYDDEDDELEDDEEEFEDEEDEYEDEEEEEVAGGGDVEAIYEEADILLDEFQDYLKGRGIAREDRARYDETLQVFVDDYLAAYEVGKLTDMNRDEIDTYLQDYLVERERIPKRKLADTKETFAIFYTFLCEHGHITAAVAGPIIQYCQA